MAKIIWGKLVLAIALCQLAGIVGSVFTFQAIPTWYATLNKPFFSPPNWVFGPVWTALYTLMGVSLYLIWTNKSKLKKEALSVFYAQLIINSLWSMLFFGLKNPALAFIVILLLWVLIAATIVKFYKFSKLASYLLIPYLLWVGFASVLNLAIVLLN
ncbi:tryptophan-rich sensory protein [Candidatus Microgenomates bacterium]|nr:MAG: tryptophan-rich sensory protein [Candidatus Microgenomates bacterium]